MAFVCGACASSPPSGATTHGTSSLVNFDEYDTEEDEDEDEDEEVSDSDESEPSGDRDLLILNAEPGLFLLLMIFPSAVPI
ncbi:hypothetical protein RJT34_28726 [Clitoria ternatea]|uniref:Uncharacterized protein n=1 Tax=Clitoria ternatea TaxID=43366 RepID=A0AAN9F949_CLITE